MHFHLPHLTYEGAPLDDPDILGRLPESLSAALRERNGCVAFLGGLHIRGACRAPAWHSLRTAWEGNDALYRLFPEVRESDIPFAEDAFGDQLLIREGKVVRLDSELGEIRPGYESLETFFEALLADPAHVLGYEPLLEMRRLGHHLEPGQLYDASPPFAMSTPGETTVELRPMPAIERRRELSKLAERLHGLPEGTEVNLDSDS